MDANLQKALLDRVYDKRKVATLELERQVREALTRNDRARINLVVEQLCALLNDNPPSSTNPQSVNARNGGLIGLAGIGIALGVEIAAYLEQVVPPILACFSDPDSKIRYFACESFYNISKACKGEILMYFNEIFDALSKLAADSELSVKNGAELLDRLLKDIVCEAAPHYVSQYQDISLIRARQDSSEGNLGGQAELDVAREKIHGMHTGSGAGDLAGNDDVNTAANKAFSLARFVPLLSERMYVLSPFTRNYLVSWITVLDSVPGLELVTFLPSFLDGLIKYLSDPNTDVRVATAKVLADFLREIQEAAELSRIRRDAETRKAERDRLSASKQEAVATAEDTLNQDKEKREEVGQEAEADEEAEWIPAQEVRIDYAAIMEILLNHISYPDDEIQATTQQWIAEFLVVVKEVVVPFTPRLLPAILPSIAHHSPAIQSAANVTNVNLYQVVEQLPWVQVSLSSESERATGQAGGLSVQDGSSSERRILSPPLSPRLKATPQFSAAESTDEAVDTLGLNLSQASASLEATAIQSDPFDLQTTVNALTLQLIDEHEETRVAALEWLLMLHQKAPRRILSINDGTFPALLKTLSDPSEDVIRCDLRLLAQMSGASDDAYNSYLANLVNLFSTDRRLLEARGSLIIRQLCSSLHTERVFRTLAEILEKDEDLEFASIMITNLNMILITSPELSDFRKRLKNLETRDGQQLFVGLYKSWCHNSVATLSLCLLAQAYEHASNLLNIFTELEVTVSFLIQIDKLVQLLESPVFMTLRLQLLEPDRYPHLLKTLYGLLMLLPQSSAFATLRNRLNAVSALGYLHIGAGGRSTSSSTSSSATGGTTPSSSTVSNTRSKIIGNNREDLKWNELLVHFKVVQSRHERSRRAGMLQTSMGEVKYSSVGARNRSGATGGGGSMGGGGGGGVGVGAAMASSASSINGPGSRGASGSASSLAAGGKRRLPATSLAATSGAKSQAVYTTSPLNPAVSKANTSRAGQSEPNAANTSIFTLPIGASHSGSNVGIQRPTSPSTSKRTAGQSLVGATNPSANNLTSRATSSSSASRSTNAR